MRNRCESKAGLLRNQFLLPDSFYLFHVSSGHIRSRLSRKRSNDEVSALLDESHVHVRLDTIPERPYATDRRRFSIAHLLSDYDNDHAFRQLDWMGIADYGQERREN